MNEALNLAAGSATPGSVSQPHPTMTGLSEPGGDDSSSGASPRWPFLAPLAIIVVSLMFVAMAGVVYYRSWWAAPSIPSIVLAVDGHDQPDAVISIDLPESTLRATLSKENNYTANFHLPPGNYNMRVEWQKDKDSSPIVRVVPVELPEYAVRKMVWLAAPPPNPAESPRK